jgi:hypothetical protein
MTRKKEAAGLEKAAVEAFSALDVADALIERAYGTDVPQEWTDALRAVANARSLPVSAPAAGVEEAVERLMEWDAAGLPPAAILPSEDDERISIRSALRLVLSALPVSVGEGENGNDVEGPIEVKLETSVDADQRWLMKAANAALSAAPVGVGETLTPGDQ